MIDWGRRAGRCQGHQMVHRGSCHPKTPRDVLISKGDGWQNPSSDLSRPGIPGSCGPENPSWAGGMGDKSSRGSAAPLGTSTRKHMTAHPRRPRAQRYRGPRRPPGACTYGTSADHRPGRVANQGARGRQHPNLQPVPWGPRGARRPLPTTAHWALHTPESLPVFWEDRLLGEWSVPMEMSESDTLFPTGQTAAPQRLRLSEPPPALLPETRLWAAATTVSSEAGPLS